MKNKETFHSCVCFVKTTVVAAALICLAVAAVSCRTIERIEVPVPVHDTTYVTKTEHDSVFVENKVTEYVKGDTVFLTKTVTKYVERTKTDTVREFVEKPIELVKTEEKIVEKPLNWLQKTLVGCGVLFIISFFVGIFLFILGLKRR